MKKSGKQNIVSNTLRIALLVLFVNGFGFFLQQTTASSPNTLTDCGCDASLTEKLKATAHYHFSRLVEAQVEKYAR